MNTQITAVEKDFAARNVQSSTQIAGQTKWSMYALAVFVYVAAMAATDAFFMGDANDYVESIVYHINGKYLHFGEFGHLLWRPFGWVMTTILHPVTSRIVGPYPNANVMLALVWINLVLGLVSAICLVNLLRRYCRDELVIGLTLIGFVFSQGILNFSQTGSPYIAGLAFLLIGLCFVVSPVDTKKQFFLYSVVAGFAFALSVGFWFLFVWALPAAILAPLILNGVTRERIKFALVSALSFSVFCGAFYAVALVILRITSFAALKAWVLDAGHGINVRGLTRMVLGFARSFINMGNDGMLMKRFLLHDAYNPVSVWQLAHLSLWKLALFYVFAGSVLWLLWNTERRGRFFLLLVSTLPILGFAYFFGPGDIERYLGLYPFFFLLMAYAVECSRASNWVKVIPATFLMTMVFTNALAMYRPTLLVQQEKIAARLGDLPSRLPKGSELVAVNWQDEVVNFYRSFPFHEFNQGESYRVAALVTPGIEDNKYWREDFATRALRVWAANGELWLSKRAISQRPAAEWNWVEGDDQYVAWKEFAEFFASVKFGESRGGEDGFHLVLPSEENKQFLQKLIDACDPCLSRNLQ